MKTKITTKRPSPKSLRLDAETQFLLTHLALKYHTNDAGAVRRAIKWCYAQQCPTPIVPQLGPIEDVGNVLALLEKYYSLLATVARKFYPIHFPDEPAERGELVDVFHKKCDEALLSLGGNLDRLRALALAAGAAQHLDLKSLREYGESLWKTYQQDRDRLAANDPKITNRPAYEVGQRRRLETLRLLHLSGIWFHETFKSSTP